MKEYKDIYFIGYECLIVNKDVRYFIYIYLLLEIVFGFLNFRRVMIYIKIKV